MPPQRRLACRSSTKSGTSVTGFGGKETGVVGVASVPSRHDRDEDRSPGDTARPDDPQADGWHDAGATTPWSPANSGMRAPSLRCAKASLPIFRFRSPCSLGSPSTASARAKDLVRPCFATHSHASRSLRQRSRCVRSSCTRATSKRRFLPAIRRSRAGPHPTHADGHPERAPRRGLLTSPTAAPEPAATDSNRPPRTASRRAKVARLFAHLSASRGTKTPGHAICRDFSESPRGNHNPRVGVRVPPPASNQRANKAHPPRQPSRRQDERHAECHTDGRTQRHEKVSATRTNSLSSTANRSRDRAVDGGASARLGRTTKH